MKQIKQTVVKKLFAIMYMCMYMYILKILGINSLLFSNVIKIYDCHVHSFSLPGPELHTFD